MSSPHPVHPGNYLHYPSCLRLGWGSVWVLHRIYIHEQGDHGIKVRYPWLPYLCRYLHMIYFIPMSSLTRATQVPGARGHSTITFVYTYLPTGGQARWA